MSIWNFELALNEPIRNFRSQKASILLQIGLINTEMFKSEAKLAKISLIIEHDKLNQSSKQEISWTDFQITVTHRAEIFYHNDQIKQLQSFIISCNQFDLIESN